MKVGQLATLAAALALLALAVGCLFAMVGLLITQPALTTFGSVGLLVLFGNLTFASTVAGLYLLDSGADQKRIGIRNLTAAGWGLVAITANIIFGAALGIGQIPEYVPALSAGRAAALAGVIVGL